MDDSTLHHVLHCLNTDNLEGQVLEIDSDVQKKRTLTVRSCNLKEGSQDSKLSMIILRGNNAITAFVKRSFSLL